MLDRITLVVTGRTPPQHSRSPTRCWGRYEGWKNAAAARDQELEDQFNYLRRQLDVWQEEARRKDAIIMTMAQRIPELEPASEPSESPETATPAGEGVETLAAEKPSWLKRFFGIGI